MKQASYEMKKATRVLQINKQGEFLDVSNMCEVFSVNLFLKVYHHIIFPLFYFSQFSINVEASEIKHMQLTLFQLGRDIFYLRNSISPDKA